MSSQGFPPGPELRAPIGSNEGGDWRCPKCASVSQGKNCPKCSTLRPRVYSTRSRALKEEEHEPQALAAPLAAFAERQLHKCGVCDRSFSSAEHLRNHLIGRQHQQQLASTLQSLDSDDGEVMSSSGSDTNESDEEHNNKTAATDFAKAVFVGAEAAKAWSTFVAERKEYVPPPTEPEKERSEALRPGAQVMARYYLDSMFYPATISKRASRRKNCVAVDFDDGDRQDVPTSDIHFPQNLDIGQDVLAHPEEKSPFFGPSDYFPGRVVNNSSPTTYVIEFYNMATLRCRRSHVIVREFPEDSVEMEEMPCNVCGLDNPADDGILCDACNGVYHFTCVDPPITSIPEGAWFCPACQRTRSASVTASDKPCACGLQHATVEEALACDKAEAAAPTPPPRKPLPIEAMDLLASKLWSLLQSLRPNGPSRAHPTLADLASMSFADFAAANHQHVGAQWKPLLRKVLAAEAAVAQERTLEHGLYAEAERLLSQLVSVEATLLSGSSPRA